MIVFYQISIYLYYLVAFITSFFNPKAKKWIKGRKNIFETLSQQINKEDQIYWFHCASLGEFEQGKPVIDLLKLNHKDVKILITFFSPSGYEARKNYENADYVCYLPIDTPKNARQFLEIVQPQKAFFIKYEFWFYYLSRLYQKEIPTYLISGIFRKNQLFFKWYGLFYRKMLKHFTYFFVQNESSMLLLQKLNFHNVTVTSDTRLDRVYENSLAPEPLPLIEKFKNNKPIIILGSSWQKEEKLIAEYIESCKKDFKFIIAPHDVSPNRIQSIKKRLGNACICYSAIKGKSLPDSKTLIIDTIGILSSVYQYTDIAFIGGGFTGKLHNILEPAGFNNAILFGPNHHKFHEAEELMKLGAAFEINDTDDLIAIINRLVLDDYLEKAQTASRNYVKNGIGATELIFKNFTLS